MLNKAAVAIGAPASAADWQAADPLYYTSAMISETEWEPSLDAVAAAADFHRVLLEDDDIRVLEVRIPAGAREPFHTHQWQSVFVVFGTPHLRYFTPERAEHQFEIEGQTEIGALHLAPEPLHSLENIDTRDLFAFRIELKHAPPWRNSPVRGPILQIGSSGENLCLESEALHLCLAQFAIRKRSQPLLVLRNDKSVGSADWLDARAGLESLLRSDIVFIPKYLNA